MAESALEMAKDLVSAQIIAGGVSPEEVSQLLTTTHQQLVSLKSRDDSGVQSMGGDAVIDIKDWRKSITKHAVICLECGISFKQLGARHLRQHDLDGRSYREKYGIPRTQSLASKTTTARRKEIVEESRPWEKTGTYKKAQGGNGKGVKKAAKTTKSTAKRKSSAKRAGGKSG